MTVHALVEEARKLSFEERWEVIEELMEMGGDQRERLALTPAQREDLDRRLAEFRAGKAVMIDGDEAMKQLRERRECSHTD